MSSVTQLYALHYDIDGDGETSDAKHSAAYPNALDGMGCPDTGCIGYELTNNLSLDPNVSADVIEYGAILEGNGYTISNLYINNPNASRVGLFSHISSNAIIRNFTLSSVDVTGGNNVGAVAGSNGGGTVSNVTASGTVTGGDSVGGLVGYNDGSIDASSSSSDGDRRRKYRRPGWVQQLHGGSIERLQQQWNGDRRR